MTSHYLRGAALAAALLGTTPAFAQAVEPMTSKALLLKPLTLTKLSDLDFGTIVPSGSGDLVTINADSGARTSPSAGLVTFDPGNRARFASSGVNNEFVVLEISEPTDLSDGAGNTLTVTRLDLDQGGSPLRTLTPESQVFFLGIGGQVFVRADQPDGTYSGTFTLTANYL
ncbi:MAG: DUF4402 domain-containing protein [Pseudomonadota bacterium]|nr:DUF4402 domain-containing protein [Pseudomonadota bacterium]